MSIRKIVAFATVSSLSSFMLLYVAQLQGDTLIMDGQSLCGNISSVNWKNGELNIACDGSIVDPDPVIDPDPVVNPEPVIAPVNSSCPDSEPKIRIERFSGRGVNQEYTLANETVLVVPFDSGDLGAVKKIALADPAKGEHFKKTVIISTCPGVYNPEEYDFTSSVDVCALTGLEMSFSVITGENRSDYEIFRYRCVLLPNQQYFLNIFQRDAGNRPPYTADKNNTCRTNQCGVRVSIR